MAENKDPVRLTQLVPVLVERQNIALKRWRRFCAP